MVFGGGGSGGVWLLCVWEREECEWGRVGI